MADQTCVDPDVLAGVSSRLTRAGDALDSAGGGAPGIPDAGEFTAVIGTMMALLTDNAGNLVAGLNAAGAQVGSANAAYEITDITAAQGLQGRR